MRQGAAWVKVENDVRLEGRVEVWKVVSRPAAEPPFLDLWLPITTTLFPHRRSCGVLLYRRASTSLPLPRYCAHHRAAQHRTVEAQQAA